jgi:hypothetical protein
MHYRPLVLALGWLATINTAYAAEEVTSSAQDQQSVAVTIYNSNLALVKDQRKIKIPTQNSTLAFRDVSAQIAPATALLRSLNAPGKLSVLEQNFNFDLLSPQKLLEKYVGKSINVIHTNPATGAESTEQAQVLSANDGVVLKFKDRIETGIPGRMAYPDVPVNLRDHPTLLMSLSNSAGEQQEVELSYLTSGLAWKADYVAELNQAENKLDLSGWVTLTNTSGASYQNAKLQLVAGDVNTVQPAMLMREKALAVAAPAPMMAPAMTEQGLLEYHLYTLDRPTTIADNQSKQVSLLNASGVPARKELLLQGGDAYAVFSDSRSWEQTPKIAVYVEFDNKESSHLGVPLPKGIMRVYKKDASGNAQFVGEDSIDHTPTNEKVRLKLGNAFDVTARRVQTDYKDLGNNKKRLVESAYKIVLKNAKKSPVTVNVQEAIAGDWTILEESQPHEKLSSNLAGWKINVPAEGETTLTYRVQAKGN